MKPISIYIKGVFEARSNVEYRELTFDQIQRSLKMHVRNGHVRITTLFVLAAPQPRFVAVFLCPDSVWALWGELSRPRKRTYSCGCEARLGSGNLIVHPANLGLSHQIGGHSQEFIK